MKKIILVLSLIIVLSGCDNVNQKIEKSDCLKKISFCEMYSNEGACDYVPKQCWKYVFE